MPQIFIADENDSVEVSVNLSPKEKTWIDFDEAEVQFRLSPMEGSTPAGLTRVRVTLEGSKGGKSDYIFNFWVNLPPQI